jgi:hypothetical protein
LQKINFFLLFCTEAEDEEGGTNDAEEMKDQFPED